MDYAASNDAVSSLMYSLKLAGVTLPLTIESFSACVFDRKAGVSGS